MALPGIERAEPLHLKADLPDNDFCKEESAYIRTFLLQIILLWKESSTITIIASSAAIITHHLITATVND